MALRQVLKSAAAACRTAARSETALFANSVRTIATASSFKLVSAANRFQRMTRVASQQQRGIKTLDFGGVKELVYERTDFPKEKIQEIFKNDTMCVLGYGTQGRGQSLNMRDHGLNVVIGLKKGLDKSWQLALKDGWVEGKNLFPIEEAVKKSSVIMYLISDAAQKLAWPTIKPLLTKGKTLYFSHGFSVVYKDQTGVVPPKDVDVVMVAPKGSGTTLRRLFKQGKGLNSSVAVMQDVSGKATERAYALGVAIGSGYMYPTTFEKEVYSDLTGERGVLMGAIQGIFQAQYEVLRKNGHSPSEAFNETVEEATQSLYPLVGENGMDWMYSNCSATAQRGALDWAEPFRKANLPVLEKLYEAVRDGSETARIMDANTRPDYRQQLEGELRQVRESEMWRAGATVRSLRPERQ